MITKWKFSLSQLSHLLLVILLALSFSNNLPVSAQTINYQFNFGENIETLEQKIQVACQTFGCNSDQLIRVMKCESKGKNISNPSGKYSGIFQFTRKTWIDFSQKAGIPNADIWDTDAQIYTTTWAFSNGLSYHWSCRNA